MLERDKGHVYGGILLDHDLQLNTITAFGQNLSGSQVVDGINMLHFSGCSHYDPLHESGKIACYGNNQAGNSRIIGIQNLVV